VFWLFSKRPTVVRGHHPLVLPCGSPTLADFVNINAPFHNSAAFWGLQLTMKDKQCKAIKVSKPESAGFFTMHSQFADIMVFFSTCSRPHFSISAHESHTKV